MKCHDFGTTRVRALHIHAGNLYGGIESFLATLARLRDLCLATELGFALSFEGRLADELRHLGVAVHMLGPARVSRPWTIWRARRRLEEILKSGDWNVAASHGCWSQAIFGPVVRRFAIPLIFWGHSILTGRHWLERWACRIKPDRVVANSCATRQAVATHLYPKTRSEVIYLPVARMAATGQSRRLEIRAALGTPSEAVLIIAASRMEPGKGHLVLLDALSKLSSQARWHCWIVGGAQRRQELAYFAKLRRRATALGINDRTQFLGTRADVPDLMSAADIFCQANTAPESFGIVFVEALHEGLPVVTTAFGGAVEIIDDSCGMLLAAPEAGLLTSALEKLIGDAKERRRLGASGPARAAGLCDPAAQIARIGNVFREVARA